MAGRSPSPMRVLYVEDELRLARTVQAGLEEEGFAVDVAPDGLAGEALARAGGYDVVVVDWRLPGQDGPALVRRLRADGVAVPVLMLTALADVESRVAGLDAGADDYLGKPFAFAELVARLRALDRRARAAGAPAVHRAGPVLVDGVRRLAAVGGRALDLRPKEFGLLAALAERPGVVVSRADLAERVWADAFVSDNAVDVTVSGLRARLASAASAAGLAADAVEIETVRGVGYRLALR